MDDFPKGLGQPARRALAGADLKQLHGIGPKAVEQLRAALEARGLSFAKR